MSEAFLCSKIKGMLFRILVSVCFFFSVSVSHAQNIRVSGKVVNEKNEPLSGVSVSTQGAGTKTDLDGYFTLSLAPGKKYELVFSAVGYSSKTVDAQVTNEQFN